MKIFKVILVGAGLLMASSLCAQNATPAVNGCDKKECVKCDKKCDKACDKKCDGKCQDCKKCDKKCDGKCDKKCDMKYGKKGMKPCPFEGLNLTDQQMEQVKALRPEKCRKDSLKRQSRQDYLNDVKKILTPEQYQKFLENSYVQGGQQPFGMMNRGGMKGAKPDFKKCPMDKPCKEGDKPCPVKAEQK
ncbi:MAG: hypothetical protein HUK14_00895 [Muribaculaceae bacterium]|nr:hypothetical protein [Muribaculaceae bacterium]